MKPQTTDLYDSQKAIDFYETRYAYGYLDNWHPETKHRIFEVIRSLDLPEQGEALDFGCGSGILTEVVQQALPKWKIYGTDISAVAIDKARQRFPQCSFFVAGDESFPGKKFEFLFTHHVLEHVHNLHQVFYKAESYLKPTSAMLHILPCGNEGSLEHRVCILRRDGINQELENRFFFEDVGHVRRLSTEQLSNLCAEKGFSLTQAYYAHQNYGAIDWITGQGPSFVWTFTDPSSAVDAAARNKLRKLRYYLGIIALTRFVPIKFENHWRKRNKTIRNYILLALGLPWYIVLKPVDMYWKGKAREEWNTRSMEQNGSEMFLFFSRQQ